MFVLGTLSVLVLGGCGGTVEEELAAPPEAAEVSSGSTESEPSVTAGGNLSMAARVAFWLRPMPPIIKASRGAPVLNEALVINGRA